MKKLFTYATTIFLFIACKSKSNWSSADKEQFKTTCNSEFAVTLGAKAKDFCSCFQEKIEKKYATKAEADKASHADIGTLAVDCPK